MSFVPPAEGELDRLRAAVSDVLDHESLRAVAREIGMSATGLSNFVDGAEPYRPTLVRLRKWYAERFGGSPAAHAP